MRLLILAEPIQLVAIMIEKMVDIIVMGQIIQREEQLAAHP